MDFSEKLSTVKKQIRGLAPFGKLWTSEDDQITRLLLFNIIINYHLLLKYVVTYVVTLQGDQEKNQWNNKQTKLKLVIKRHQSA